MVSFFEKLKKGMGIEESKLSSPPFAGAREVEEPVVEEEGKEEKLTEIKAGKESKKSPKQSFGDATGQVQAKKEKESPEIKIKKLEIQNRAPSFEKGGEGGEEDKTLFDSEAPDVPERRKEKKWPTFSKEEEGQLAIDVYQTENDLVIQSAIAGVRPENLDISMERDIITIKGSREKPSAEEKGDYFTQECFWGRFSREVILPAEVDPGRALSEMKNGILTIRIPKILREKKRKIIIRG